MSTTIVDLPIKEGIIQVINIWKTKVKIRYKHKDYTINTPKDMGRVNVGDVFRVKKVEYKVSNGMNKRLECTLVDTTMVELLPLKIPKFVTLLNKGNGLAKIQIENDTFIVLEKRLPHLRILEVGEKIQLVARVEEDGFVFIDEYTDEGEDIFT